MKARTSTEKLEDMMIDRYSIFIVPDIDTFALKDSDRFQLPIYVYILLSSTLSN